MIGNKLKVVLIAFILIINLVPVYSIVPAVTTLIQTLSWAASVKDGTWTIKALSTVSPEGAEIVSFVIDPKGTIAGKGLGALKQAVNSEIFSKSIDTVLNPQGVLTQEALQQVAKENPQIAGQLAEILQIKSQLTNLGLTNGNVNFDKDGNVKDMSELSIKSKNGEDIAKIIGIKEGNFNVNNAKISKEKGITTITAEDNAIVSIKDKNGKIINSYEYMDKGSYLKFNDKGDVIEADITPNDDYEYTLGDKDIGVENIKSNSHNIKYKEGLIELTGKKNSKFTILSNKDQSQTKKGITLNNDNSKILIKEDRYEGIFFKLEDGSFFEMNIVNGSFSRVNGGFIAEKGSDFSIYSNRIFMVNEGKIDYKSLKSYSDPEDVIIKISGNNVKFKGPNGDYSFDGNIGFYDEFQGKYKIYSKTTLNQYFPGKIVDNKINYYTGGDLDLYYMKNGKCSSNCIQVYNNDLLIASKNNPHLIIDDQNGVLNNIYNKKILDDSKVDFIQKNVKFTFSKDPYIVDGPLEDLNLNKLEAEYEYNKKARITRIELNNNLLIKNIKISNCPPCLDSGGNVDTIDLVRLNALNVNKDETLKFADDVKKQFGGATAQRLSGYFDSNDERNLVKSYLDVFNKYPELDPSFYTASVNREGFIVWVNGNYYTNPDAEVSGFGHLGLDRFGEEVESLKKSGCGIDLKTPCLRNDFKDYIFIDKGKNEKSESIINTNFLNKDAGLEAFGAVLWQRQSKFLNDANKLGLKDLSKEEVDFWSYLYYNSGEGTGNKLLKQTVINNEPLIPKTFKNCERVSLKTKCNAIAVTKTSELLDNLGLFDISQPSIISLSKLENKGNNL